MRQVFSCGFGFKYFHPLCLFEPSAPFCYFFLSVYKVNTIRCKLSSIKLNVFSAKMNKVPEALKHFNYEINASSPDERQNKHVRSVAL